MIVKLLIENHLEFLSLKGGCTGSCESTLIEKSHCWKSHVAAHYYIMCCSFMYFILFTQIIATEQPQQVFHLFIAWMNTSVDYDQLSSSADLDLQF